MTELPEDYWARQERFKKALAKIKDVKLPCGVKEKLVKAWDKKDA